MKHIHVPPGEAIPGPSRDDGTLDVLVWGPGEYAEQEQFRVMLEALAVYAKRNVEYRDNWRRMGWRGMLVRVRERAERLWDSLWGANPDANDITAHERETRLDDAIDLINFACFLVRAVRDGNRDGSWWGDAH